MSVSTSVSFRKSTRRRTVLSLALDDDSPRVSYPYVVESATSFFIRPPHVQIEDDAPSTLRRSEIYQLMDDMGIKTVHDYKKSDARDLESREPSFTKEFFSNFNSLVKYRETTERYRRQFQHEITKLLAAQPTAYEAARFHRHISYTTLWPPLHNRHELSRSERIFHPYSKKQKRRLQKLLMSDIR